MADGDTPDPTPLPHHRRSTDTTMNVKTIQAFAVVFMTVFGLGGAGAYRGLSSAAEAATKELGAKLDEQGKALTDLKLTVAKIEAHGEEANRTAARADTLATALSERVASMERLQAARDVTVVEHERRLAALEGGKK